MNTLRLSDPASANYANDYCNVKEAGQMGEMNMTASKWFIEWDINSIIDYIINTHHQYAKENAVIIYDLTQKVLYRHNKNHPELKKLAAELFLFLQDLLNYLKKEEEVLFPDIKQLIKNKISSAKASDTVLGFIRDSVMAIRKEHQATGKDLKRFRKLTNDYMPPADACYFYKNLFEKMRAFENELFLYAYLENNILLPRISALMENTA
jgi:regulator of cell morphogenesis and NO signaling